MTKEGSTNVLKGKTIAQVPAIFDSQNVPRWDDDTHLAVVHPLVQFLRHQVVDHPPYFDI
jgi:hypothetical protein